MFKPMPMNRFFTGLWILLLLALTFAASQAQPTADEGWLIPLVMVVWIITLLELLPSPLRRFVGAPIRKLRSRPILYWLVILLYICGALSLWIVPYQPTNGRQIAPIEFVLIG